MIIYVDLLVTVNFVIDFLLLSTSAVILRTEIKTARQILASIFGGISSLYIFIESRFIVLDIAFRIVCTAIIVAICVGIKLTRRYLKFYLSYLLSSIFLGGIMFFISQAAKLNFVAVNNTYIYLNISPMILIMVTAITYICIKLYFKFKKSTDIYHKCFVTLFFEKKKSSFYALVDTGNRVKDILGNSEIMFITPDAFINFIGILPEQIEEKYVSRFRLIPINTINSSGVKSGIRIDRAEITCKNKVFELKNPILIASEKEISNGFEMIISSEILLKEPIKEYKEGEKIEVN